MSSSKPRGASELVAEHEHEVAGENDDRRDRRQPSGRPHEDDRSPDHEPVGERVGHLSEARLDVPAAREPAVQLVGEGGAREEDPCPPRRAVAGVQVEPREDGDRREAQDRERVRELAPELDPGHARSLCRPW